MAEGKPFVKTGELFDCGQAFAHNEQNRQLFNEAMREALHWHLRNCPDFKAFMRESGLPEKIDDLSPEEIPPLLVTIFKEFRLISVPDAQVKIELTSSGTGGRKSAIVLDNRSYKRIQKIVLNIFDSLGLVNQQQKVNYLCFTYDPHKAGSVGTAFSDKMLTGLTARRSVFYAIRWSEAVNDFDFDLDALKKKLKNCSLAKILT